MHAVTRETRGVSPHQPITTQLKSACAVARVVKRSECSGLSAPDMQHLRVRASTPTNALSSPAVPDVGSASAEAPQPRSGCEMET